MNQSELADPTIALAEATETDAKVGYLFAYFVSELSEQGEQIRFAVSLGSTLTAWRELNDGEPVLVSHLGDEGVRDPFILRDERRGKFVIIATDLRVWPTQDWRRSYEHGSRSIVVWESDDLIAWSEPWLLEVAPEHSGNAWAPKAFWSDEREAWVIFWASIVYPNGDRSIATPQTMFMATTTDFRTVSAAATYVERSTSIIDMTFLEHDGQWYRFSKAEIAHAGDEEVGNHILLERGSSLLSGDFEPFVVDIGKDVMVRGEGPAVATSLDGTRWNLLIDEFGLRGYLLFETDDLTSGSWNHVHDAQLPRGARHGSVLAISERERQRLVSSYVR